jgi:hypothetical protein
MASLEATKVGVAERIDDLESECMAVEESVGVIRRETESNVRRAAQLEGEGRVEVPRIMYVGENWSL